MTRTVPGQGLRVDEVDLDELVSSGRAQPAQPGRPAKKKSSRAGCRHPMSSCASGRQRPPAERRLGEIWVRSPGLTDGYVNVPNEELFEGDWHGPATWATWPTGNCS